MIRFAFHEVDSVVNPTSPSFRSTIHTGQFFFLPSFVNVVNETYVFSPILKALLLAFYFLLIIGVGYLANSDCLHLREKGTRENIIAFIN